MSNPTRTSWLDDTTFNLLIDYYPEVPVRPYGSGATRENHLELLRGLDLGYVCIYVKGHSGRTTYKSTLGTQHPMLAQDMPKFYREICDELGIKLVLYYSGLVDGIAAIRHPEWTMRGIDGSSAVELDASKSSKDTNNWTDLVKTFMMYPVCPLSPYFDEWVSVHLREMVENYNPDGIWIDGDWPGPCYCNRCVTRFCEETGHDRPIEIPGGGAPGGQAYREFWVGLTREWRMRLRNYIHGLKPDCLYSSGNINTHSDSTPALDWRSGDFFSPRLHRMMQSCAMRRYTNQGVAYDAYTVDSGLLHERPQRRTRTKTLGRMLQEGAGVLANGGKWGYWTYPMPNGALLPSRMKMGKIARDFAREREDICKGTDPLDWTAILEIDPYHTIANDMNSWGACKALTELHRSPQIIDDTQVTADMPFDLLVVAGQKALATAPPELFEKLRAWVENGGKLITTGSTIEAPAMQELLGVKLEKTGVLREGHVILDDGPTASFLESWDKVLPTEAKAWYPLYRSWDDDNIDMRVFSPHYPMDGLMDEENPQQADFPAATIRHLSKGVAAHIPARIFLDYWTYGEAPVRRWIGRMLDELQPTALFSTDAPCWVEVALRTKNNDLLVHFVNGNTGRDLCHSGTDDLTVDDIPTIGPIKCQVRCAKEPQVVTLEPGEEQVKSSWSDGVLSITLPQLEIHRCIKITNWQQQS